MMSFHSMYKAHISCTAAALSETRFCELVQNFYGPHWRTQDFVVGYRFN